MLRRITPSLLLLVCAAIPSVSHADRCGSYGSAASLVYPRTDATVPRNVAVEVHVGPHCNVPENQGPHAFRVLNDRGVEIPFEEERTIERPGCRPTPCERAMLRPRVPNDVSRIRVQVRRAESAETAPWTELASYAIAPLDDRTPPRFRGVLSARAASVSGGVPIQVGHAPQGRVVETSIRFRRAVDAETEGRLRYQLEAMYADAADWVPVANIWPRGRRPRVTWTRQDLRWGQTIQYRIRVRDAAGNETIGARIARTSTPPRPRARPRH